MERFFLQLRSLEEMPIVVDAMADYGKVVESSAFVLPLVEQDKVSEIFVAVVTIEITTSKIEKVIKDKHIKESTKWIYYMEKRAFQLNDVLREAGVSGEQYRVWFRESQGSSEFSSLYHKALTKEEILVRWARAIYFYLNTGYSNEAVERMISYWNTIIEEGEELFMRMPNDFEFIEDEELGLNSSLFITKQKFALWTISRKPTDQEKLEAMSLTLSKFDANIRFVNDDSDVLVQFTKFLFLRFIASKNMGNFILQTWMIKEKVKCLELMLNAKIWTGHEFAPALFDSHFLRKPLEREKWDKPVQKIFKESIDAFISKTEENIEFLINESARLGRFKTEVYLRINFVSFLLAFNINTKYQSKINANLKALKNSNIKLKAIQKNIFALELEHMTQLKNFKKIAVELSKLRAFENISIQQIVPELYKHTPDKNMCVEVIEKDIFALTDFGLKSYHYGDKGLELRIYLNYKTKVKALEFNKLSLFLTTGVPESEPLQSEELPSVALEKESGSFELVFAYPASSQRSVSFFIIHTLQFEFCDILFQLKDFPEIQNKNINLDAVECLCINSSGFLNRLSDDQLFFEVNGPNYFYIEFSLFDSKSPTIENLIIDIQKSSKYLIINPKVKLFSNEEVQELLCEYERIKIPAISGGRYVLVLTLYLLHFKMKNYKLKINCSGKGKPFSHVLNLKAKQESFYYLENQLQYVNESFSQLRISNKNKGLVDIYQINDSVFDPARSLKTDEELSLIIKSAGETVIHYELIGQTFQQQAIHQTIMRHDRSLIKQGSEVQGRILRIEQFILNKDLNIQSLEIKNKKEVKIYEQNHFVLRYKFNGAKSNGIEDPSIASKRIYLEFKWNKEKYCIIGKHRFLLKFDYKEKHKEVAFIPFESGFLHYPQILLVETKADGSEIQHLLNENKHLKIFFVHENVIKAAQFAGKSSRHIN